MIEPDVVITLLGRQVGEQAVTIARLEALIVSLQEQLATAVASSEANEAGPIE